MPFSPGQSIRFGWETFKGRPWFFLGATVIIAILYVVVGGISSGVDAMFGGSAEEPTLAGSIVSYGLGALIGMGVTAFYLAAHDHPDGVELAQLWHPQPYWKFLGTSILATIAIVIGFVLLIVPGLIALVLFMFSTILVIDRGLGPIEAMKESMRITAGHRWSLFGLLCLLLLILFVGVLALFVGLLVAMPVSTLAFVHAYRTVSGSGAGEVRPPDARLTV